MDKNVLDQLHVFSVADPTATEPKAAIIPLSSPKHVEAAAPILKSTSTSNRIFYGALVLCGVALILWTPLMQIGIALIIVGIAATLWQEQSLRSKITELAKLPDSDPKLLPPVVINGDVDIVDTDGGAYVRGDVTTKTFIGRDQTVTGNTPQ